MDNGAGAKGAAYGMQSLEARYPLLASVQAALGGGRGGKAYLVDLAVAGDARIVSPSGDAATSAPGFEVEVLVLAISVEAAEGWGVEGTEGGGSGGWDGAFSLHVVRVSSAAASWVGTSSNVKVCFVAVFCTSMHGSSEVLVISCVFLSSVVTVVECCIEFCGASHATGPQ